LIVAGETTTIRFVFAAPKPPPKRAPLPSPPIDDPGLAGRHRAAMIVGWGTTGALVVAAAITGAYALKANGDTEAALDRYPITQSDVDDPSSKARKLALVTDVLAGLAVVSAGISLYLTLARPSRASAVKASKAAGLRFDVTPAGALLRGRF
jgi:hypothetical protein